MLRVVTVFHKVAPLKNNIIKIVRKCGDRDPPNSCASLPLQVTRVALNFRTRVRFSAMFTTIGSFWNIYLSVRCPKRRLFPKRRAIRIISRMYCFAPLQILFQIIKKLFLKLSRASFTVRFYRLESEYYRNKVLIGENDVPLLPCSRKQIGV